MLVECPIGVVILVVPHLAEDRGDVGHRDNGAFGSWRLESCAWGSAGRTNVTDCGGRDGPLTK